MTLLDILKIGGASGAVGLLVGIGLVTWIRPDTTKGSLFLMLVAVCAVSLLVAVAGLVRSLLSRKHPDGTGAVPPAPHQDGAPGKPDRRP